MKLTADTPASEEAGHDTNKQLHAEATAVVDEFNQWFSVEGKQAPITNSERAIIMTFLWWGVRERKDEDSSTE